MVLTIFVVGLCSSGLVGLFIFFKPEHTIELQRRFYEKINWRIEPISMYKEIRNTKIMGISLIVAIILIAFYAFTNEIF
jgi:hypothetical protein